MRRLFVSLLAAAVITISMVSAVSAGGPQPGHLQDHGWTCFDVPELGVHCSPPGAPIGSRTASPLLYFFDTTNANDAEAALTGTEQLLSPSVYNDQPCPQDGLDVWDPLGFAYACHHK